MFENAWLNETQMRKQAEIMLETFLWSLDGARIPQCRKKKKTVITSNPISLKSVFVLEKLLLNIK